MYGNVFLGGTFPHHNHTALSFFLLPVCGALADAKCFNVLCKVHPPVARCDTVQ